MEREPELKRQKTISDAAFKLTDRDQYLYYLSKRVLDIVISLIALILLFPIMVLIAILIRIDSAGPVIYIQKRVGSERLKRNDHFCWNQKEFSFYKFRTMVNKANSSIHQDFIKALINHDDQEIQALQNSDTQVKKLVNDPRVTRLGHFLRQSSLDELPQFWNVFRGDMSLIGPRPAIPYEVEMYKPWYFRRFEAKPGLTGLWQIVARNSADFDDMIRLDIEYVDNQSFWLDLKIMWMTPWVIIRHRCVA
ncbi:MAG: sugar transferase [Anaerolineaceae bacterium]|nr:sugar transferase [Anaerolineaceae bacterium]